MPKNLILTALFCSFFSATALGQTSLKTANSVEVKSGFIAETVVLADDGGKLFLEFIKGDRVAKKLDGQIFDGEILPPLIIDVPDKAPRARMRELLSFEVIADNNEEVEMIDQFTALHPKDRLRQGLKNQAGQRRLGAQLITLFPEEDAVSRPSLWHYDTSYTPPRWERLGGIMGETPAGEANVFSSYLYGTGKFTIWDENPQPTFSPTFPIDEVELAEDSPFPSVTESSTSSDTLSALDNLSAISISSRDDLVRKSQLFAVTLEQMKAIDLTTLSSEDQSLVQESIRFGENLKQLTDLQIALFDSEVEISQSLNALQVIFQDLQAIPDIPENQAFIESKEKEANDIVAPHIEKLEEMRTQAQNALTIQQAMSSDSATIFDRIPDLTDQQREQLSTFNNSSAELNIYLEDLITRIDLDINTLKEAQTNPALDTIFLTPATPDGSQGEITLVPATPLPNQSTGEVPSVSETVSPGEGLVPNNQLGPSAVSPIPILNPTTTIPAVSQPNEATPVSTFFRNNILTISREDMEVMKQEADQLDTYYSLLRSQKLQNAGLSESTSVGSVSTTPEEEAELYLHIQTKVAFGELSSLVIESLDNQIALSNNTRSANELDQLWRSQELDNASKILNRIEDIETYRTINPQSFQNRGELPNYETIMRLLPKIKAHYQSYYDLPLTTTGLQANAFQDFGTNEGDLPVAGGLRFHWLFLIVLGIIGFSIYAIRQRPY